MAKKDTTKPIEGEVVESTGFEILALPGCSLLSGTFRFRFGEKEETFSSVVERLDGEINDFRTQAIKKIARELGLNVNFEN